MPYPDAKYPHDKRLVEAAPKLLKGLKGVLHWTLTECECKDLNDEYRPCDYCTAQEAIAIAEGTQT